MLKSVLSNLCAAGMQLEREGGGREDTQFLSLNEVPSCLSLQLSPVGLACALHEVIFSIPHAHPQPVPFTV